jgi:hypothetical protein
MKETEPDREHSELLAQTKAVEAAVQQAVQDALRLHKRAGNPVAEWRDGRVVWVPADQIQLEDETAVPSEEPLPGTS